MAIIELFARRRLGRRRVDPVAYQSLHRELIAACRSLAESADEGERGFYEGLEGLITPWLNPKTLAQADGEILGGLLARGRQVERELGGRRFPRAARAGMIKSMLLVMGMAGAAVLLTAAGFESGPAIARARDWSETLWLAARRSTDLQRLGVVAAVVVFVSIRVVSRTARA